MEESYPRLKKAVCKRCIGTGVIWGLFTVLGKLTKTFSSCPDCHGVGTWTQSALDLHKKKKGSKEPFSDP